MAALLVATWLVLPSRFCIGGEFCLTGSWQLQETTHRELAILTDLVLDEPELKLIQSLIDQPPSQHLRVITRIDESKNAAAVFSALLRPVEADSEFLRGFSDSGRFFMVSNAPRWVGNPFYEREIHDTCQFIVQRYPDSELAILASIELAKAHYDLSALCAQRQRIDRLGKTTDTVLFRFWESVLQFSSATDAFQLIQPTPSDLQMLTECADLDFTYEDSIGVARLLAASTKSRSANSMFATWLVTHRLPIREKGGDTGDYLLIRQMLQRAYVSAKLLSRWAEGCYGLLWALDPGNELQILETVFSGVEAFDSLISTSLDENFKAVARINYLLGDISAFYKTFEEPSLAFPKQIEAVDSIFLDIIEYNRSGDYNYLDELIDQMPAKMRSRYLPFLQAFAYRRDGKLKLAIEKLKTSYRAPLLRLDPSDLRGWSARRSSRFWKYVNYQFVIWTLESDDLEAGLKFKPTKELIRSVTSYLRLGKRWARLLQFVDSAISAGVVTEVDVSRLRLQSLFQLGQYQPAIQSFNRSLSALHKTSGSENADNSNRKLDPEHAIESAFALKDLDTAKRLIQLQVNDPRVEDFGRHQFAFRIAVLENRLADAKNELDLARREESYYPGHQELKGLTQQQKSTLLGDHVEGEISMEEFWLDGSQWIVGRRRSPARSTDQILKRLRPIVGESLSLSEVTLDDDRCRVWRCEFAGKRLIICDRAFELREDKNWNQSTREKVGQIERVTSFHFSSLEPSARDTSGRSISELEVVKTMLDETSLLLGTYMTQELHSRFWLQNMSQLELDRLARHGFALVPHSRSLTLPTRKESREHQQQVGQRLANFMSSEAADKQLRLTLAVTAGLATESVDVLVTQLTRKFDGQVELRFTIESNSRLNAKLQSGVKGRLVFNDYEPLENQLMRIRGIEIRENQQEPIIWRASQ